MTDDAAKLRLKRCVIDGGIRHEHVWPPSLLRSSHIAHGGAGLQELRGGLSEENLEIALASHMQS
eukprot:12377870-Prorocentrum_lima.AAC.1